MWTPDRVKRLRKRCGLKQEEFCERIGVSVWALRDWEQGRSEPSGPAAILLQLLERDPEQDLQPA